MHYWERNLDRAEFAYKALELANRIRQACANVDTKKYTFLGLQKLTEDATTVYNLLAQANRLRLDDPLQAQQRAALMNRAVGMLDAVAGSFGVLHALIHFPEGTLADIDALFWETDRIVKSVIESDKKRR